MLDEKRVKEAESNVRQYLQEGLLKKQANETAKMMYTENSELSLQTAQKILSLLKKEKPELICPKCASTEFTGGFSCQDGVEDGDYDIITWQCLKCEHKFDTRIKNKRLTKGKRIKGYCLPKRDKSIPSILACTHEEYHQLVEDFYR